MAASKVNGLVEVGGTLCKQTSGILTELPATAARLVFERFVKWILQWEEGKEPQQVICVGYNNSAFDDHFLLNHLRRKLEPDLLSTVRRKVFTADAQKLLQCKGKLSDALAQCGGTEAEILALHDALQDCKAVAKLLKAKKVTMDALIGSSRSLEVVQQRDTNPLIRAGLITDAVANKMTSQMTCEQYLQMSDTALTNMPKALGVNAVLIRACLFKWME